LINNNNDRLASYAKHAWSLNQSFLVSSFSTTK
jgi:hypothetical protein